jgi:hypothetical protein
MAPVTRARIRASTRLTRNAESAPKVKAESQQTKPEIRGTAGVRESSASSTPNPKSETKLIKSENESSSRLTETSPRKKKSLREGSVKSNRAKGRRVKEEDEKKEVKDGQGHKKAPKRKRAKDSDRAYHSTMSYRASGIELTMKAMDPFW